MYTVSKYVEIPAAGTLSFMETSDINNYEKLGFVDRETAVFINAENYREVFQEYFDTIDDPKWEQIAENGRRHVLENFRADIQVNKLVDIMVRKLETNDF
jgi:spore maturation protein CgeB